MAFSIKKISLDGAALVQGLVSKTNWLADLKRGLSMLQSGSFSVIDRSFSEVELHKLRGRLDLCNHKLDQGFQSLGKKSMLRWQNHQELDKKEQEGLFAQIETLKSEKEQVVASITAHLTPMDATAPGLSDKQLDDLPEKAKSDIPDADVPKEIS